MFGVVRLFSPPVPPLLFVSPERFFSPVQGFFFSRFIHSTSSLASSTHSLHSPYSFC